MILGLIFVVFAACMIGGALSADDTRPAHSKAMADHIERTTGHP